MYIDFPHGTKLCSKLKIINVANAYLQISTSTTF